MAVTCGRADLTPDEDAAMVAILAGWGLTVFPLDVPGHAWSLWFWDGGHVLVVVAARRAASVEYRLPSGEVRQVWGDASLVPDG